MPMLRSCAGCAGMEATELSPCRHIREECGVFGIYSPQESIVFTSRGSLVRVQYGPSPLPNRERHFHAMRKDVIEHGKVHFKAENEQKSTKRARFETKSDLELQPRHQEGREQKTL